MGSKFLIAVSFERDVSISVDIKRTKNSHLIGHCASNVTWDWRMKLIGKKVWAILEGYIPGESTGPAPELTSHEFCCILNATPEEARARSPSFLKIANRWTIAFPAE
jgi:hypothetical protein